MLKYTYGAVAEWLRRGLQNLVHRFNSGRRLQNFGRPEGSYKNSGNSEQNWTGNRFHLGGDEKNLKRISDFARRRSRFSMRSIELSGRRTFSLHYGRVAELVYAFDLKSNGIFHTGSSPVSATNCEVHESEYSLRWELLFMWLLIFSGGGYN